MKPIKLKVQLHQKCCQLGNERINALKTALTEVQSAANNETKSSAGDKHETGRAMAQLETEKLTKQLAEALRLSEVLEKINPNIENKIISLGSLVMTNNGIFYIAASLGKLKIDGKFYFAISAVSPIGKQLIGLKLGNCFSLNNRSYKVIKIV